MDSQVIYYLLSFLIPLILFGFIVVKISETRSKRPPGPRRLPIIGNIHQVFGHLPHHRLRDLANKYGPVMSLQLGEPNVVISSPEAAKQVLKTQDIIFADRPFVLAAELILYNSRDIGFCRYGDYWKQMRKISVVELLSAKRVQSFRRDREAEVYSLVSDIRSSVGSPVDLSMLFVSLANCLTSRTAFGVVRDQQDAFVPVVIKIFQALSGFTLANVFPSFKLLPIITGDKRRYEKLHKEVDVILESVVNEHKARRSSHKAKNIDSHLEEGSLVEVLLDLQERGNFEIPITTEDIKAIILDMFLAGTEASSTVIEWIMSEIIKNPRVLKKVQDEVRQVYGSCTDVDETKIHELKYLNLVVKEGLRLHPPAPLLVPRVTREQAEINGYQIPAKTRILVNAWAVARDPNYWKEPEKFYPERFINNPIDYKGQDFEYIPFGSGRRICPGMTYGTAIVELTLANLLYHFNWKMPGEQNPEDLDMTEQFGLTAKRKVGLCLIPIPYTPPSSTF